ncbi:hypothetical protein BJX64DRAFT_282737 [Aspergillus heterothallicus]
MAVRPQDFAAFQATMHTAARQEAVHYADSYSVSIRADNDDVRDTEHLQAILRLFNMEASDEIAFNARFISRRFSEILIDRCGKIVLKAKLAAMLQQRVLVIIQYTGSEYIPSQAGWPQAGIQLAYDLSRTVVASGCNNVDFLYIFNCPFLLNETRPLQAGPSIHQVIAQQLPDLTREPYFREVPKISVIGKLAAAIERRRLAGHRHVDFADLVASSRTNILQVASRKADTYFHTGGAASICLPFPPEATVTPGPGSPPSSLQPTLRAVFCVDVWDLNPENMKWLIRRPDTDGLRLAYDTTGEEDTWDDLLSEPEEPIDVEAVYPTEPEWTCFVLSAAWSVWSKVAGIKGYSLIAETSGDNFLSYAE